MANVKGKPRGKPFGPGNHGRPLGSKNKRPMEIREMARRMMEDSAYLTSLAQRIAAGTAPHMEILMAHYAWGKPRENIAITNIDVTALRVMLLESRNGTNGNGATTIEAEPIVIEAIESKNGDDE